MANQLQFRISSGLKNIIGKDLITDDFIAIFELVKNSFDAHATEVEIVFEDLKSERSKIIILDNGKGMNYHDLINKWLFVAYSAKKEGIEDIDYRHKIQTKMFYAGAKGIGRFSCDKLGSSLKLISKKDEPNSFTEQIEVDWDQFEVSSQKEFVDINVKHETLHFFPSKFQNGTILEISSLRNEPIWNKEKIIKLRNSLSKLINPFQASETNSFKISIIAEEYEGSDLKETNLNQRVNGPIENHLLDILKLKTTKIVSQISEDGETILTKLFNNGEWLYSILENNIDYKLLKDVLVELYFLDRKAKVNFTKLMGIKAGDYGSVFLYKNGIRIYPFGEPGEDSFELDKRQQNKLGDFIGTSQLIGRIEIFGANYEFKETTSRGDGLIKNSSYFELKDFFIDNALSKLEGFYKKVLKYGFDLEDYESSKTSKDHIIKFLADLSDEKKIISIDVNPNILELLENIQESSDSTKALIKSIEKIAANTDNFLLLEKIKKVKNSLDDAIIIAELAEAEIKIKEKEIDFKLSENLFLKSVKSQELDEVISFLHHIGISSGIIDNYLTGLFLNIQQRKSIPEIKLNEIIKIVLFENKKIQNISKFATKANFKLYTDAIELNINEYLKEYINNILALVTNKEIEIFFKDSSKNPVIKKFRPIEINILVDNLLSNSKKAKASWFKVLIEEIDSQNVISFSDNGAGISKDKINEIFNFGYTTSTEGSGIGLFHVMEIVKRMGAKLQIQSEEKIGTTFKLII